MLSLYEIYRNPKSKKHQLVLALLNTVNERLRNDLLLFEICRNEYNSRLRLLRQTAEQVAQMIADIELFHEVIS